MRSIAAASGVPAPSLYQYFADRDAILLALVARDMEEMDAQVLADLAVVTELTLPLLVETTMRAFVTVYQRRPAFVAIWLRGRANPAIQRAGREHNREVAATLLAVAQDAGLVTDELPPRAALLAVETGDRVFQLAYEHSDTGDQLLVEEGIAMLTAYLARYVVDPGSSGTHTRE